MGWLASKLRVTPSPVRSSSTTPRSPRPTMMARLAKKRGSVERPMLRQFPARPPLSTSGEFSRFVLRTRSISSHSSTVTMAPWRSASSRRIRHDRLHRVDGTCDHIVQLDAVRREHVIEPGQLENTLDNLTNRRPR